MGRKELAICGLSLFLPNQLWLRTLKRHWQQRLPTLTVECDQLLLWGSLFLSAVSMGLLVLYLILQP